MGIVKDRERPPSLPSKGFYGAFMGPFGVKKDSERPCIGAWRPWNGPLKDIKGPEFP